MNTRARDRVMISIKHPGYSPSISATTPGPQYVLGIHTLRYTGVRRGQRLNIFRRRVKTKSAVRWQRS